MNINNETSSLKSSLTSSKWRKIGICNHTGIAIPLFSLHSKSSSGIGEYLDLIPLITWCKTLRFDVIQLLPLNDTGHETSPYSAISAFALNPLHLKLCALPHTENDPSLKIQLSNLQELNKTQRIHYESVRLGKEQFLREYYNKYGSTLLASGEYKKFKEIHAAWLTGYTLFKSFKILHNWQSWESWPEPQKNFKFTDLKDLPKSIQDEMEYHAFIQYLCFQQFIEVKKHAETTGVFIKGDIPILINRDSADVWMNRDLFLLEYAAGAPPDMYALDGQKWGFPLYNWDKMAENGYKWWIERLQVASLCYHIYRIDHIVGFFRIWAIPLEKKAKEGFFIPKDENTWICHGKKILEMMIQNCDMLPIGEDLGTVPPEVRITLKSLGICGTKVIRWERHWDKDMSFIDPKDYIKESMTTVSTHDSETLAEWWINAPNEAKLYSDTFGLEYTQELTPENRAAILYQSNHSGSLFHINLLQEYLALIPGLTWPNLSDERINTPGTISDLNWSYKFKASIEQITFCIPLKQSIQIQNDIK